MDSTAIKEEELYSDDCSQAIAKYEGIRCKVLRKLLAIVEADWVWTQAQHPQG
jgi:hypothetical protein